MTTAANFDDGLPRRFSHGETINHSLIELVKQGDADAWQMFMGIY